MDTVESKRPLVTIGIPTYNQPGFLSNAIESVLNQTLQDFEIVVVDDCSTDNTSDIVRRYDDHRIRYVRTHVNLRPPKSWNVAVREAQGEFFALLPHDDVWLPNFLETMVTLLRASPNIGFSQCNFYEVQKRLEITRASSHLSEGLTLTGLAAVKWQLSYLRCNPAAILFRISHLRSFGAWREHYWDDWAIIVRIAYSSGFTYTPIRLSCVRGHERNLSKVLAGEGRLGALYVVDQLQDIAAHLLPHTLETLTLVRRETRTLGVSVFFSALKCLFRGELRRTFEMLKYARLINPIIPFEYLIISRGLAKITASPEAPLQASEGSSGSFQQDQSYLRKLAGSEHIPT